MTTDNNRDKFSILERWGNDNWEYRNIGSITNKIQNDKNLKAVFDFEIEMGSRQSDNASVVCVRTKLSRENADKYLQEMSGGVFAISNKSEEYKMRRSKQDETYAVLYDENKLNEIGVDKFGFGQRTLSVRTLNQIRTDLLGELVAKAKNGEAFSPQPIKDVESLIKNSGADVAPDKKSPAERFYTKLNEAIKIINSNGKGEQMAL